MTRWQKTIVCFAAGLAFPAMAATNDTAAPGNTYGAIAARNVFDLKPVTAATADVPPTVKLPKITINGITSILGPEEVLFKVAAPNRPGQSAGEDSYMMAAGQSQDDIEVQRIDVEKSTVTFSNHGVIQELALANAPKLTTPVLVANPAPPMAVMDPNRAAFERSRMPEYLGGGGDPGQSGAPFHNKTLEQRILMIEAQRQYYKDHNDPRADDLPPTVMTPEE